jgi:tol-pal system protein YbgF
MSPLLYRWLLPAVTALVLVACETTPAEPDPTTVKLNEVDERLGRVERVVNNQSLVQLSQRIDLLETQLRDLRGQLEQLQNSDELLRKQQRDLYADLDRRLNALSASPRLAIGGPGAAGEAGAGAAGGNGGDVAAGSGGADSDQAAYTRAFDALKANDYSTAITRLREFLRAYAQSPLAGNAQYWLGEAYYVTHDYDNAAAAFRGVGEQYPQSRKVPDALLKLGITEVDQKKLTEARATFNQVLQRYPGSDAAKLASARLQNLPPDSR